MDFFNGLTFGVNLDLEECFNLRDSIRHTNQSGSISLLKYPLCSDYVNLQESYEASRNIKILAACLMYLSYLVSYN